MKERDLMEGLNHIDDDLIEEAAGSAPKVKRLRRLPLAAAAVIVLGIGVLTMRGQLLRPVGSHSEIAVEKTTEEENNGRAETATGASAGEATAEMAVEADEAVTEMPEVADEALTEKAAVADEAVAEYAAVDAAEADEAAAEAAAEAEPAVEAAGKAAAAGEPAGKAKTAETAAADMPAEAAAEDAPEKEEAAVENALAEEEVVADNAPAEEGAAAESAAAEHAMLTASGKADRVGIPGEADFGGDYRACTGYEELYDSIQQAKEPIQYYLMDNGDVIGLEDIDMADAPLAAAEDGAAPILTYGAAEEKEAAPAAGSGTADTGMAIAEAADLGGGLTGTAADSGYSKTNVMTEGVDESDIVKTDGRFIYRVKGNRIGITDIRQRVPGA